MNAVVSRSKTGWAALPVRERWLVLGALVVAGAGLIDTLILKPAERQTVALRGQIDALRVERAQRQTLEAEQARLRRDEAALQSRLSAADASIARASTQFAGPDVLRERIRALSQDGALRLVSLVTLPVEPVTVTAPSASTNPAGRPANHLNAAATTTVYRFPVTATVEGPYAALHDYLVGLETSQQGLRWQSMALNNSAWPAVRMELRLYLMSDRPQWRGP